jgi:hypothetical protein
MLDDGKLQFNILTPEYKLYEVRCDDLSCDTPEFGFFDPNE